MTRRSRTVAAVVEGPKSHTVLCELLSQIDEVRGPLSKPVAVLCQHRVYTAGSHRIPYAVHARVLQGCLALPRVLCLFENLIAFSGGVRSQGFDLLREGDQTPCTTSSSPAGRYVPRSISSPCRVILNMKPRCWAPTVFLRCALVSSSGINAPTSSSHQIAAR